MLEKKTFKSNLIVIKNKQRCNTQTMGTKMMQYANHGHNDKTHKQWAQICNTQTIVTKVQYTNHGHNDAIYKQ